MNKKNIEVAPFDPADLNYYGDLGGKSFGHVPPLLVGQWKLRNPGSSSPGFRFFADGKHYIALYPYRVTFTTNGQAMTLNGVVYERLTKEAGGLDGLWRENGSTTNFLFFNSGVAYEMVGSSLVYQLAVDINVGGASDMIRLWPLRSIVEADSSTIKYSPIYWTNSASLPYTVNSNVLTLDLGGGNTLVYDLMPIGPLP